MSWWDKMIRLVGGDSVVQARIVEELVQQASDKIGEPLVVVGRQASRTGVLILWINAPNRRYLARVSNRPASILRIKRNAEILRWLARVSWLTDSMRRMIPECLFMDEVQGHTYCIESCLSGSPGRVVGVNGEGTQSMVVSAAEFITHFHSTPKEGIRFDRENWDRYLEPMVGRLGRFADRLGKRKPYSVLVRFLEKELVDREMVLVPNHGNYWLGNILFDDSGSVSGVVDWDLAMESGFPLVDLYHLLLRNRCVIQRKGLGETILESADQNQPSEFKETVTRYCLALGIGLELVVPLQFVHWMIHLDQHVRHETPALLRLDWLNRNVHNVLNRFEQGSNGRTPVLSKV